MQQPRACPALTCSGDFQPTGSDQVVTHRALKADVTGFDRRPTAHANFPPFRAQNLGQGEMDQAITFGPSGIGQRFGPGNDQRVSPIRPMIHGATTGAAADPLDTRDLAGGVRHFSEATDAAPIALPGINAKNGLHRSLQQPFIDSHRFRALARCGIDPPTQILQNRHSGGTQAPETPR